VRGKLYELLTNCIPPDVIVKTLLKELLKRLDDEMKQVTYEVCARTQQAMHPMPNRH
jgi:replication factor C subunit 3/5